MERREIETEEERAQEDEEMELAEGERSYPAIQALAKRGDMEAVDRAVLTLSAGARSVVFQSLLDDDFATIAAEIYRQGRLPYVQYIDGGEPADVHDILGERRATLSPSNRRVVDRLMAWIMQQEYANEGYSQDQLRTDAVMYVVNCGAPRRPSHQSILPRDFLIPMYRLDPAFDMDPGTSEPIMTWDEWDNHPGRVQNLVWMAPSLPPGPYGHIPKRDRVEIEAIHRRVDAALAVVLPPDLVRYVKAAA